MSPEFQVSYRGLMVRHTFPLDHRHERAAWCGAVEQSVPPDVSASAASPLSRDAGEREL